MGSVSSRLRGLRESIGISQKKMAEFMGLTQSSVNRYELGTAEAPYRTLIWYADYFDVSMDYIFARTDKPQGKLYKYQPKEVKRKLARQEDWQEFVEFCFDPSSPMYGKMKEMIKNMVDGEQE